MMRMRRMRILPPAYASTSTPLVSRTLNCVLGSTSCTVPSISIISSLAKRLPLARLVTGLIHPFAGRRRFIRVRRGRGIATPSFVGRARQDERQRRVIQCAYAGLRSLERRVVAPRFSRSLFFATSETLFSSASLASCRALTSNAFSSSVGGCQSRNLGLRFSKKTLEDSFTFFVFTLAPSLEFGQKKKGRAAPFSEIPALS